LPPSRPEPAAGDPAAHPAEPPDPATAWVPPAPAADAPEPAPTAAPAPEPAPTARRRGRTLTLLAAAAVLGVLAGTGTGYAVQQRRAPSPLPPVGLHAPLSPTGTAPAATLPASRDAGLPARGDLRKLLLPKPSGAVDLSSTEGRDNWSSMVDVAVQADDPASAFTYLASDHFQRAAVRIWGHRNGSFAEDYAVFHLIQFRDQEEAGSDTYLGDAEGDMSDASGGEAGTPIPGTLDGRVWIFHEPSREPYYEAHALARRGNVVVDIWYSRDTPIPKHTIVSMAQRQLERL
jgi:hypothetical protein